MTTAFLCTWTDSPRLHTESAGAVYQGIDIARFAELFPYIIVQEVTA